MPTHRSVRRSRAALVSSIYLFIALQLTGVAWADGIISGRIADRDGVALPGARVVVAGIGLQALTDSDGRYVLTGVPSGAATLTVDYLGFDAQSRAVNVADGARVSADFTLAQSGGSDLETVTVLAIRDAAARAANQQRNAANAVNVVSSDSIGRFPDPNIAEALQRVVGVAIERDQGEGRYINVRGGPSEFSAVSIDGIGLPAPDPTTRAIDLDTIPSDIVNQLEITKSLRPDQDADSIGGAVNIVTQSPFDYSGFRMRASAGASYNDLGGTHDTRASFTVSDLFGEQDTVGLLLSASYSKTRRQLDNIETTWRRFARPDGGQIFGVTENLFKDYDTNRERIALTATGEWRISDAARTFLRGTYSRFTDDEWRNRLGILWSEGTLQPGSTSSAATFANTRLEKQIRHRIVRNEICTISAGARHEFEGFELDYSASFARAEQTYPRRAELLFRSNLRPRLSYDYSGSSTEPSISLFNTNEHLNVGAYAFRENAFRSNDTIEDVVSFDVNSELPVRLAGRDASWKFGLKYSLGSKDADEERLRNRATGAAPSQALAALLSDRESRNFGYLLGSKFQTRPADEYFDAAGPLSPRRLEASTTADYRVDEDIAAAYGQLTTEIGRMSVLAGLRVERTKLEGSAPVFNTVTNRIAEQASERSYTDVFPGINLRYRFSAGLQARLALTRAIARPNFDDVVPRAVEAQDGSVLRVTQGNPDLAPTLSNNFDAAIEYYFEPIGVLSAGVFYKDLEDYAYTLTLAGSYLGAPAQITRPENAPSGEIRGLEVNWQQQFTQLPGWLAGFGVFANYTYADASIDVGRVYAGRSKFPLPGQSKSTTNFAIFYERSGFNARLSWTDRSDYLDEINADDGALDLYWEGRSQLDFTAAYQATRRLEVFLEAKNLTNTAGVRYYGERARTYEFEKFGYTVFLGGRVKL